VNKIVKKIFQSIEYRSYTYFGITHYQVYLHRPEKFNQTSYNETIKFEVLSDELVKKLESANHLDVDSKFIQSAMSLNHFCILAMFDDEIIGYAWFSKKNALLIDDIWLHSSANTRYIYKCYVDPRFRGKNILAQMVDYFINAESKIKEQLFCFISPNNSSSINAFKKVGFKKKWLFLLAQYKEEIIFIFVSKTQKD
jgi:ribosomal protein S18 acetylase RimI-like enzyme